MPAQTSEPARAAASTVGAVEPGQPRAATQAARLRDDADDLALLQRVARQDRRAFEALYHRYTCRIGGYLWKLLRSAELVEEVLDDVLLVVWQKAETFTPNARVSSWIFGIAHNKALKALSRLPRERVWAPEADAAQDAMDDCRDEWGALRVDEDPERILMRQDLRAALDRALGVLSAEQRAVIELAFGQGFSYPEIAAIVGCPVNTVKTRTFHARRRLMKALDDFERPGTRAQAPELPKEQAP